MPSDILKIKTSVPPLVGNLLPRENVTRQLDADVLIAHGFARRLTLISAPAGFGKTTLVRSWLRGREPVTAWYSLDKDDNEAASFWTYVITALQSLQKKIGVGSLDIIRDTTFTSESQAEMRSAMISLLNDLFSLDTPSYLVLDDYHLIENQAIHQDMLFFIENMPSTLHLIVTTRSDPPWPLFKWRAKGDIAEIRLNDLKFSEDEAAALFREVKGIELTDAQASALYDKTEGWVTGLQLAAFSLSRGRSISEYIEGFTGSQRDVLHFLGEEVFTRQRESVREFLLATSILSRFSAPLCDAVTRRFDSAKVLAELERDNMFVIPLDEQGVWYRYHHLFADLLQFHLKLKPPAEVNELHTKAGDWFLAAGEPGEAVRHALLGGNQERAAQILHDHYEAVQRSGLPSLLAKWPDMLPLEVMQNFPRLVIIRAFYLLVSRGMGEVAECLELATRLSYEDEAAQREYSGMLATVRAFYNTYANDFTEALKNAELALEYLPAKSFFWRLAVSIFLGDAQYFAGNLQDAHFYYLQAYQSSLAHQHHQASLSAAFKLAASLSGLGRLKEAEELTLKGLRIAKENGLDRISKAGLLWGLLGELLREQGSLEEAERCVERGLLLSNSEKPILAWCYIYRISLYFSQQDYSSALQCVRQVAALDSEAQLPVYTAVYSAIWEARALHMSGNLAQAKAVLSAVGVGEDVPMKQGLEKAYLVLTRILLAEGRTDYGQIQQIITQAQDNATGGGHTAALLECLVIQSYLAEKKGSQKTAEDYLYSAVQISSKAGYLQVFRDERNELDSVFKRLLSRLKRSSLPQDAALLRYAQHICQHLEGGDNKGLGERAYMPKSSQQLIEELSQREIEVLTLISQGLSNQDICEKLFLSMSTVKWHTSNIYAKLGVRGRTQAVAVARRLGVLS